MRQLNRHQYIRAQLKPQLIPWEELVDQHGQTVAPNDVPDDLPHTDGIATLTLVSNPWTWILNLNNGVSLLFKTLISNGSVAQEGFNTLTEMIDNPELPRRRNARPDLYDNIETERRRTEARRLLDIFAPGTTDHEVALQEWVTSVAKDSPSVLEYLANNNSIMNEPDYRDKYNALFTLMVEFGCQLLENENT